MSSSQTVLPPPAIRVILNSRTTRGKRKRVCLSEAPEELSQATKSKEYWFDDGSMVLHVEDTLFCVHRSVLSRHSSGFEDAFPLAQSEWLETKKTFEGCDVVELPGDQVEDWDRVLSVIYNVDPASRTEERSIEMVGSMLRLGKRYRFDRIYGDAFQELQGIFPTDLHDWGGYPDDFCEPRPRTPKLFKLMQILLEIGNQTLLPALFYCCSTHVEGPTMIYRTFRSTPGLAKLDPSLAEKLVIGREKIFAACLELAFGWAVKPPVNPICGTPQECQSLKYEYLQKVILDPRPLVSLEFAAEVLRSCPDMCGACKKGIREAHDAHRRKTWDRLPSFFGLPDWKDLKDE